MMKILSSIMLLLSIAIRVNGQETFSIVAVDPLTKEVGSAGASCVQGAAALGGVILISDIIPGRGGVNAQAYVCVNPHVNLVAAIARMNDGMSPAQIINWLKANDGCSSNNFNPEYRQYGIVDFDSSGNPRAAAFTGTKADDWKGHKIGSNYAIQGNILLGPQVLDSMEARFLRATGSLADRLMYALQGANFPGADARCLNDKTSSTSAYLQVYRPTDEAGKPVLRLNVAETPRGKEPIDSLQKLFNNYKSSLSVKGIQAAGSFRVYPNPAHGSLKLQVNENYPIADLYVDVTDANGILVIKSPISEKESELDISKLGKGFYILLVRQNNEVIHWQKVLIQ